MKNLKPLIFTASDLQAIRYKDNGEPLVNLEEFCPDILCDYRRTDSGINQILVRKSIVERLQKVQRRLKLHDERMQLLVVEGYRSPAYQERYYLKELLIQRETDPALDFELLLERTHQFVALPSVAGHPTGGAVDLTIAYEGAELEMGGVIADFRIPELLPTYSPLASSGQRANRLLLHDLMVAEGFAPFYGEWWHFSYGDPEWAAFYGKTESLYAIAHSPLTAPSGT